MNRILFGKIEATKTTAYLPNRGIQMGLDISAAAVIIQGEDKNLDIRLAYETEEGVGDPFDLLNTSEILVLFRKTDGGTLVKSLSGSTPGVEIVSEGGGKIRAKLKAADTVQMQVGDSVPVEVRVTQGGFLTIIQIQNGPTVLKTLFPNVSL